MGKGKSVVGGGASLFTHAQSREYDVIVKSDLISVACSATENMTAFIWQQPRKSVCSECWLTAIFIADDSFASWSVGRSR